MTDPYQAAGICSLIKTLMMLRTHKIPPQPGMPFKLNPLFPDLLSKNVYIASKGMTLRPKKTGAPLRVFVNSFDASVSILSTRLPVSSRGSSYN
jgi:acyl transferase domain-containing protein